MEKLNEVFDKQKAQLTIQFKHFKKLLTKEKEKLEKLEKEQIVLTSSKDKLEGDLENLKPELEGSIQEEDAIDLKLASTERKLQELYVKQGMFQFKSKKERDDYLNGESQRLDGIIRQYEQQAEVIEEDVNDMKQLQDQKEKQYNDNMASKDQEAQSIKTSEQKLNELKQEKDQMEQRISTTFHQINDMKSTLTNYRNEWKKSERNLSTIMNRGLNDGLNRLNQ
ncbi:hypothetical protein DICPUDRAFT_92341, partial [Dictyostelium purpureum]